MFDFEYELPDTGVFEDNRYFDVIIEYAKANPDDLLIRITVTNRGPDAAPCHVLPTLWFRNTWSWGYERGPMGDVHGKPKLRKIKTPEGMTAVRVDHPSAGTFLLHAEDAPVLLFTENETNTERLFGTPNATAYVKDAFHRYLVKGDASAVNPSEEGTKTAALYSENVEAGRSITFRLRFSKEGGSIPFGDFDEIFDQRLAEADEFYAEVQKSNLDEDEKRIQRQALAGLLWSKQFFYFNIEQWLNGDPAMLPVPDNRRFGRNHEWEHLNNFDIISMPDKWEYPWYAGWDLAFHAIPIVLVDGDFAKRQLKLMAREWYMHPNGQLPAYEWNFSDVNPPVHAWAAYRVYKIDAKQQGIADRRFLEGIFHKLLLNFTWWVNKKDAEGNNVFQGGSWAWITSVSLIAASPCLPAAIWISPTALPGWGFTA